MEQLRGAGVRYGPPVVVVVFSLQSVQLSVAKLVFGEGIVSWQPASAVAAENIGPPQLSVPILNHPPKKPDRCQQRSSGSFLIFDRFSAYMEPDIPSKMQLNWGGNVSLLTGRNLDQAQAPCGPQRTAEGARS